MFEGRREKGGIPQRERSTAEQCIGRGSERYSKREE